MRRSETSRTGGARTSSEGLQLPVAITPDEALASSTGDLNSYLVHLAHLDMPLAMKIELIAALQAIMQSFVDCAFGDDPVQLAAEIAGRQIETDPKSPRSVLSLPDNENPENTNMLSDGFRRNAGPQGKKAIDR